jgi:outer membrane protein assembly factor BamB
VSTTDRPEDRTAPDERPERELPELSLRSERTPSRRTASGQPPPKRGQGISRRQFLPRAAAGAAGLVAAGLIGYEVHPSDTAPAATGQTTTTETTTSATPATAASAGVTSEEVQSFVTRPDLRPPAVKITHFSQADTSPSYIVLSVTNVITNDQIQQGLMMFDRQGRLVWFKPLTGSRPFNLNAFNDRGKSALTWWQGELLSSHGIGVGVAIDSSYQRIQEIRAGNGLKLDLHELNLTSRNTTLVTAYDQVTTNLEPMGGSGRGPVFAGHAQEIDLATGKVLLDWNSLDHVGLDETYEPAAKSGQVLDYFHINSVGETSDGNLLISGRNTSALYKVNRTSGEVMWRMSGKKSDFKLGPGVDFHWQHHARAWSDTAYTVFDNGANGSEARSRALLFDVDESAMTVGLTQAFLHPAAFVSETLGSVSLLDDGRVFVGWGDQPYFSEFAADGGLLLDGQLPIGVRSYRAFTVAWAGKPSEKPTIDAKQNPAGGFVVRVSWNGATGVDRWRILGGPSPSKLKAVGSQIWTGFETTIAVNSDGPSFCAVGLDDQGHELGRSEVA